jgi:CheY-like chemotaxis protein
MLCSEQPSSFVGPEPARFTVLSVEDDAANVQLVEQLIGRRTDLRLLATKRGHEAIEMARSMQPDVILMDINLPDINGLDAMKILHEDTTTTHIPVIALSSNAYPRQIEDGIQAGFFLYMTKPYKLAELMASIDAALAHARNDLNGRPQPAAFG